MWAWTPLSFNPPPPPPIPSLLALIGKKENLGTRLNPTVNSKHAITVKWRILHAHKWKLILDVVRQLLHFGIQQLNFSPKSWCNSLVPDKVISVTERTFTWNLLFWTRSAKETQTSSHRCWNLYIYICFLSLPSIFQVSVTKLGRSNFYTQVERDTMKAKKYSGQDQEHIRITLNSDHAQTPIWHPDLSIVPRSLDRTQTTRSNPNL